VQKLGPKSKVLKTCLRASAMKDVTDQNLATSDEISSSLSVQHAVPISEIIRLLLGNEGVLELEQSCLPTSIEISQALLPPGQA